MNEEECISWLEKEITKEDVRVNNEETKTGIRRWVLSIMKNMVLSNSKLKNEILNEVRRKAKVEFENNLWKQRFEELNGFPMEEGLGKENIIMPFSENDYLENKTLDKVTELM